MVKEYARYGVDLTEFVPACIIPKLIERMNELDIQTDISFTQLQAWAVRKSSPILRDSLNVWLKRVHDNGLYDKLYKQYYNKAAR